MVDSNVFLINVKVLPANISDSLGSQILISDICSFLAFIKIIFADSGYDKEHLRTKN